MRLLEVFKWNIGGNENKMRFFENTKKSLPFIAIIFFGFILSSVIDGFGKSKDTNIDIKIRYNQENKKINLSILNKESRNITLYASDLKTKDFSFSPIGLVVKLKNSKGEVISQDMKGAWEGFISSTFYFPRLYRVPYEPSFEILPNEQIELEVNFEDLIAGHNKDIKKSSEIDFIKLRYYILLDPRGKSNILHTSEWLKY